MFSITRKPIAALAAGATVASFGMAQAGSAHAADAPMIRINPSALVALQSQMPIKQFSGISKILRLNRGDLVGLNPQPLPPREITLGQFSKIADFNPAVAVSLNPQPLPPGPPEASADAAKLGDEVSLNPQPLPPGPPEAGADTAKLGDEVSLNPQPLPPGPDDKISAIDKVKLVQLQAKNLTIPVLRG
jgi:hypothetical protein